MIETNDTKSRIKINNDMKRSMIVEASAGSGKTTSLVMRMVALIESGEAKAEDICTITFTKAAANEFFERFQKLLSKRSIEETHEEKEKRKETDLPLTTPVSRKRCEEALKDIDLCFMGTIDSFCNVIASEFPNEFEIPASSKVTSEEEINDAVFSIYSEMKEGKIKEAKNLIEAFDTYFGSKSFNAFSDIVSVIRETRGTNLQYKKPSLPFDLNKMLIKEKNTMIQAVNTLTDRNFDPLAHNKTLDDNLKNAFFYSPSIKGNWNKTALKVLKFVKIIEGFRVKLPDDSLFISPLFEKTKQGYKFSEEVVECANNVIDVIENIGYTVSMTLCEMVSSYISSKLREEGRLNFFDYLIYLRDTLRKSSATDHKLIDHLYKKHKFYLIDESQDTNPIQTELFFYLTGTKITDDWTKTSPRPGSLFIVGDPKQCIYRFRRADVDAFAFTKSLFENPKNDIGDVLVLSRNFRSSKRMIEAFNSSMNGVLKVDEEHQINHPTIDTDHISEERIENEEAATLKGVYKYGVKKEEISFYELNIIEEIVSNPYYTVKGKKDDTPRMVEYKDIMIVPAGKQDMDVLVSKLNEHHIPVIVEGNTPFLKTPTYVVCSNLLELFANSTNKTALYKVLKSPLFNIDDSDINKLINDGFDFRIDLYEKENHKGLPNNILDSLDFIKSIYDKVKNFSYSSIFSYLMNDQEILTRVGAKNLNLLYYAYEILKAAEADGSISDHISLSSLLSNINDGSDYERSLRFMENINAVKLANVHKVKGLQAPIVILSRPNGKNKTPKLRCEKAVSGYDSYIFEVPIDGQFNSNHVKHHFPEEKYKEEETQMEAERRRLEYVAATRSEAALFISYLLESKDQKANPWKHLLLNMDATEFTFGNGKSTVKSPENVDISKTFKGLKVAKNKSKEKTYDVISPSKEIKTKSYRSNDTDINEDEVLRFSSKNTEATILGTIIHRFMECMAMSKCAFDFDEIVNDILTEYEAEEYRNVFTKTVRNIFDNGCEQINGDLPKNILKELMSADRVLCEVPFSYKNGTDIVYGTIDCIYEKNNQVTIIDYKTNKERDIKVLLEEYEGQMRAYEKAVKELLGVDAKAHIYHIDILY